MHIKLLRIIKNSYCSFLYNYETLVSIKSYQLFKKNYNMAANALNAVPLVEIDPEGTFKYILIKVYGSQTADRTEPSKMIVRGNKRGPYHSDIYDETVKKLQELKLDSECVGGGKIQHDAKGKNIKIFGSSQGFGKADHSVSAEILKEVFPEYSITCSDE